ncbi:DNA cytosine methyltransferase [Paracoccus sp. (in: a-proteobacteria)]|uniref:DNA cytosine methyltransferase n=1 Tax=Paracoccus sp. TaxID=267 RepID=UPI0028B2061C|nr:DNA cytosine methyltransferase [Paracoccus sp. (in: a-proteobacteria)]
MRYLSVCSGIEAATQAWHPLGWKPVAFSEIEPFPSAVLAHHYPSIPNWGDMTKFEEWPDEPIDLLCGGTPCQDYSIAGKRAGMAGDRGQLTLKFVEIAARYKPRWIVWENVPGVLSSNGGRDFAAFLCDLGASGYGWAYRILDAQHTRTRRFPFAVPQRRRRVWVVGYLGDWRRAAAVLFDRESLSGHPAPRREAGQVAPTIPSRSLGGGGLGTDFDCDGGLISANSGDVGYCLTASAQNSLDAETETETLMAVARTLRGEGFDASEDGTGRQALLPVAFDCKGAEAHYQTDGAHQSLRGGGHGGGHAAVAFDLNQITSKTNRSRPDPAVHHTLPASACPPHLATPWAVRRLTPRECERLQGFPDDFTAIPWRKKPANQCPDGPRYKALGNSWAVNVADWVGERIAIVDAMAPIMEAAE